MESVKETRRPCVVNGSLPAFFHCWGQRADVIPPSIMVGGAPGGQYAIPVAVVEYGDGQVDVVDASMIQFTDRKE